MRNTSDVRGRIAILALAFLVIGALVPSAVGAESELRFIVLGDTPYSEDEKNDLVDEVAPAIRDAKVPFVVHVGDFKASGGACGEYLFGPSRDFIYGLHSGPVFYTPGDNDWTDCDRTSLNPPMSELAALDLVRRLFFIETPLKLPDDWGYARQPGFPENARWVRGGIVFVAVHVVGTNNGRKEILQDDANVALALVDARDQANRAWIASAFQVAENIEARALVFFTQADVTSPGGEGACTLLNRVECDAFVAIRGQLIAETEDLQEYGKPPKWVLLVHGDTNPYCLDRKFGGARAPELWRLNAWGDYQRPADATVITVQPGVQDEPFVVVTLLGKKVPDDGCP